MLAVIADVTGPTIPTHPAYPTRMSLHPRKRTASILTIPARFFTPATQVLRLRFQGGNVTQVNQGIPKADHPSRNLNRPHRSETNTSVTTGQQDPTALVAGRHHGINRRKSAPKSTKRLPGTATATPFARTARQLKDTYCSAMRGIFSRTNSTRTTRSSGP